MPKELKTKDTDDDRQDDQVTPEGDEDATEVDAPAEADADADSDDDADEVEVTDEVEDAFRKIANDAVAKAMADKELEADKPKSKTVPASRSNESDNEWSSLPKEQRLVKALQAFRAHDAATLKSYHDYALNANIKAGYMNATTGADGGYLVPDPDFIIETNKLVDQYGVARQDAQQYLTNSDSVKITTDTSGVAMYEVNSEAGEKQGTKLAFKQITASLREFAAIAPVTRILDEDAAINVFNLITQGFAREVAHWEDKLVFTDTTSGILHDDETLAQTVGASLSDIDLDDFSKAISKLHPAARTGAKFYVSTTLEGILRELKYDDGRYVLTVDPSGQTAGTIFGYPVVPVTVLPTEDDGDTTFAVFGNLQFTTLIRKRGILIDELREATVKDADGNSVNLATQNMTAIRADIRMNNVVREPRGFCLIGTGDVS